MAKANGESRIPVLRSSGLRPAMLPGQWNGGGRRPVDVDCIGQRVCVGGEASGILRYYGCPTFDPSGSQWCGVELDTPDGLNDGCVQGIRYFTCKHRHGILAPETKVQLLSAEGGQKASKKRLSPDSAGGIKKGYTSSSASSSPSGCSQEEITPPIHLLASASHGQSSETVTSPIPCTSSTSLWKCKESRQNSDEATPPKLACTQMTPTLETTTSPTDSERSLSGTRGSLACSSGSLMLPLNCSPPSYVPSSLSKCNSYDFDDSLGILTPDQMNTDFTATCPGSDDDDLDDTAKNGGILLQDSPPKMNVADLVQVMEKEHIVIAAAEAKDHIMTASTENSASDFACKGDESMSHSQCTISNTCPVPNPGCSFVTSISSITSLDNGYQGDGELSRPTSVAETSSSMAAPPVPPPGQQAIDVHKIKQFDTMTDSDFFSDPGATGAESDNEQEAAMAIGDRKARVIDGTLYSTSPANSVANQPPTMLMTSSAATIEDMESSGVFSDVERRPDPLPVTAPCISEEPMESSDLELPVDEEKKIEGDNEQETNLEVPKEMVSEAPAGVIKVPAKKGKMPIRNVPSKVKTMISNTPQPTEAIENQENRRQTKAQAKNKSVGKWDAVMNKIAKSQAEDKAKPKLKEVKSRVFASLTLQPTSLNDSKTAINNNNNNNNNRGSSPFRTPGNIPSRPNSARARRENLAAPKPKAKRSKLRGAESSASLQAVKDDAKMGSVNSSLSDVSRASNLYNKITTDQGPNQTAKKGAPKAKAPTNVRTLKQTPSKPKLTPTKDQNRNTSVPPSVREPPTKKAAPAAPQQQQLPPPTVISVPPPQLLRDLKHAAAGCEAMSALVQYLVHSVGAFSVTSLKSELERTNKEWALAKEDLVESKATIRRLQQSLSDEVRAHEMHLETQHVEHQERLANIESTQHGELSSIRAEYQKKSEEVEMLRLQAAENMQQAEQEWLATRNQMVADVRADAEKRLKDSMERETDLNQQIAKMTAQLAESTKDSRMFLELMHKDKDSLMQASAERCLTMEKEVDSLRAVLDLRHTELQVLRKVAAEAAEKASLLSASEIQVASLKSKVEDLQSQLHSKSTIERTLKEENKALTESFQMEMQNYRRMSQQHEELQWRLKQSSEVISRLSTSCAGNSTMSVSFKSCASPVPSGLSDDSSDSYRTSGGPEDSPRMKIVARKSDSVAYLLDMSADYVEYKMSRSQRERMSCSSNFPTKKSASSSGIPSRKPAARKATSSLVASTPRMQARSRSRSASSDSESYAFEGSDEEHLRQVVVAKERSCSSMSNSAMSTSFEFSSFGLHPQDAAGEAMVSEDDAQQRNRIVGSSSVSSSENITIGDLEEELAAEVKRAVEDLQDSSAEEMGWMEEMKSDHKS